MGGEQKVYGNLTHFEDEKRRKKEGGKVYNERRNVLKDKEDGVRKFVIFRTVARRKRGRGKRWRRRKMWWKRGGGRRRRRRRRRKMRWGRRGGGRGRGRRRRISGGGGRGRGSRGRGRRGGGGRRRR